MKRNIIKYLTIFIFLGVFTSCEKNIITADINTGITYYPKFEMAGDGVMFIDLGETYTDPGVTATENGVDIPVEVTGDIVNPDVIGKYVVIYSSVNADGYAGTVERVVWVVDNGDLTSGLSGIYTSTIVRNEVGGSAYTDLEYILIWETETAGVFMLSDAIGGYYDLGRGYGADYRAEGMTITVNDLSTNDFTYGGSVGVGTFGGLVDMTAFSVTAPSTINFTSNWDAGYEFVVTLTKVQF